MEIKKASIENAEEILKVQKEAYLGQAKIYQNFNIRPLTQTLDSIKEEFSKKTFLVAKIRDLLIGSVRFWEEDRIVHIECLAVMPEFQNKGIGTLLMKEVELQSPHAKEFQLYTATQYANSKAKNYMVGSIFMSIKSWVMWCLKKKDDGQGITTLYMRKRR